MVDRTITELRVSNKRGSIKEHDIYNVLSYVCDADSEKADVYKGYREKYSSRLIVKACNYFKDNHEEKLEQLLLKRDLEQSAADFAT
jgi:hypothetical protein